MVSSKSAVRPTIAEGKSVMNTIKGFLNKSKQVQKQLSTLHEICADGFHMFHRNIS